jgi:hypothetical protein
MPVPLAHPSAMGTKSRDTIFGPSIRALADRAAAARKEANRLAREACNKHLEASFGYERCFAIADARKAFGTNSADRQVSVLWSWIERVGPAGSNQYRLRKKN